jgi:hypothetical protein
MSDRDEAKDPPCAQFDLDGRIASPLAVGGLRVEELLLSTSSPRSARVCSDCCPGG